MARPHTGVFAVYDISSGSVGGAHILLPHESAKKMTVLASVRTAAPLQEDIKMDRFVENTVHYLEDVIVRVGKADVHHPFLIQVVLDSPWYSTKVKTIHYQKDTPFTCTKKLLDSLVDQEIMGLLSEENTSYGVYGKESVVIEKQLSETKLNGYSTNTPIGKKATTVELALVVTIAPKNVLALFSDTFKRTYGTRRIQFSTRLLTMGIVAQNTGVIENDCVLMHMSEEVTDIAILKHRTILYQRSFPSGSYSLYRTLVLNGKSQATEAIALFESYRLGKLSPGESTEIEKAITIFTNRWQIALQQLLDNNEYGFCLPPTIIICIDKRFETILKNIVESDPMIAHRCSPQATVIRFFDETYLGTAMDTNDVSAIDVGVGITALFVKEFL